MKTFVFLGSLMLLSFPVAAKEKAAPPSEPATHPDWADVRDKGLSGITSTLYDPTSVVVNWSSGFAWGFTKPIIGRRTYGWVACGTLNAKNRLGGYVGATPFWIMADASGAVTSAWVNQSMSSCDAGTGAPVNPELKTISPTMAVSGGAGVSVADELEKLAALRDKGIITQAEFDTQKARLLAR